ncbi:P-loop ATPase, Sll1717 family [Hymenobacter rubripertinctus]|nr:P-loop NTPase fold protein [Hymenobacter rubripertinctus]
MTKKSFVPKKFRFTKYQIIGSPDAESDNNFDKVFIEHGELEVLRDTENPKCVIIGRTGSGKSALIRRLEESTKNLTRIQPESMSVKYLTNSNVLGYFRSMDVNLNFFYKVLWKHVFIVELLKLHFSEDINKKENIIESLYNKARNKFGKVNPAKERGIQYLDNWSNEFWQKTEHRIKELEKQAEDKFLVSTGLDKAVFNLKGESTKIFSTKTTEEIKYKAEKIISEIQAEELYEVINIMKDLLSTSQKKYYIVIDDLDKEWASPQIVYDLITSMIEVIKEFQIFKNAKIIIALRDNLHQMLFSAKEHRGGQREKFNILYLDLTWSKQSLRELIDKRLKIISGDVLSSSNAFEPIGKTKESGFDYIIDRTFLRPRDLITYLNKVIPLIDQKSNIPSSAIKKAEARYSSDRLNALEDEWSENYGDIKKSCDFLIGMYNGFRIKNIDEERFYSLYTDESYEKSFKGELYRITHLWRLNKMRYSTFVSELSYILYTVGIIGIKKSSKHSIYFFYNSDEDISISDFNSEARLYVHKAFYSVLKINVKALEDTYV